MQMSVVPLMSALMPVPEPPPVTYTCTSLFLPMKSSAQRWPRMTMVSEPLRVMAAASAVWVVPIKAGPTATRAANRVFFKRIVCLLGNLRLCFVNLELGLHLQVEDVVVLRDALLLAE